MPKFTQNVQNNSKMDPITIGLGAVGLASKIYGGIKGAQANREAEEMLNKQTAENEAFYNMNAKRDFLETNAAKGIVEQLRKQYQDKARTIDSKTEATGGTAEENIAAKSKINEQQNDAMNSLAQQGTAFKQNAERDYRWRLSDLYKQRMSLNRQKAQNAANVGEAGTQLIGTAADVGGFGNNSVGDGVSSGSIAGISDYNRGRLNQIAEDGTDKILNN